MLNYSLFNQKSYPSRIILGKYHGKNTKLCSKIDNLSLRRVSRDCSHLYLSKDHFYSVVTTCPMACQQLPRCREDSDRCSYQLQSFSCLYL